MKKLLELIFVFIIGFVFMTINVFASGSIKPNTSKLTIKPGGTAKFTIKATNATGKVSISSSDKSVATVSASSHWMDNDSFTITVKGIKEGTATITVNLSDAATYDEEELRGSYSIKVNVSSASSSTNTATSSKNEVKNDATLSKLEVIGYVLDFNKNKTDYSLEVPNDIVELKLNAVPTRSTSKVTISGNTNLNVGENAIKINVTAKDGTIKKYTINVIRKDEIPETIVDNLSNTLKNTTKDTVALKITKGDEVSLEVLKKIKDAKKYLIINNYNENGNLLYSWTLNYKNINDKNNYDFGLSFTSKNLKKILELTNYSEMLNLNFNYSGDLPKGTKIKIYVGDRFLDGEKLNLYYYNETDEMMKFIDKNLSVENGFVSFEIEHCSEYILTRATLLNNSNDINPFLVTSIIEGIIIISLLILIVNKRKKYNNIKLKKKRM